MCTRLFIHERTWEALVLQNYKLTNLEDIGPIELDTVYTTSVVSSTRCTVCKKSIKICHKTGTDAYPKVNKGAQ